MKVTDVTDKYKHDISVFSNLIFRKQKQKEGTESRPEVSGVSEGPCVP